MGAPPRIETVGDGVVRLGTWIVNWYLLEEDGRVTVVDARPGLSRPTRTRARKTRPL